MGSSEPAVAPDILRRGSRAVQVRPPSRSGLASGPILQPPTPSPQAAATLGTQHHGGARDARACGTASLLSHRLHRWQTHLHRSATLMSAERRGGKQSYHPALAHADWPAAASDTTETARASPWANCDALLQTFLMPSAPVSQCHVVSAPPSLPLSLRLLFISCTLNNCN
jgi:hypothetical protein